MSEKTTEKIPNVKQLEVIFKQALSTFQEDDDVGSFLITLHQLAKYKGGVALISKEAGINRAALHKILSGKVTPSLKLAIKIFRALGFELSAKMAA